MALRSTGIQDKLLKVKDFKKTRVLYQPHIGRIKIPEINIIPINVYLFLSLDLFIADYLFLLTFEALMIQVYCYTQINNYFF